MNFHFLFQLFPRFIIAITTIFIGTKHQIQSNSITFNQIMSALARLLFFMGQRTIMIAKSQGVLPLRLI